MGNVHSDAGERQAYKVIKLIPFVGTVYCGASAAAYAAKLDWPEANRRGVGMSTNAILSASCFFTRNGAVIAWGDAIAAARPGEADMEAHLAQQVGAKQLAGHEQGTARLVEWHEGGGE